MKTSGKTDMITLFLGLALLITILAAPCEHASADESTEKGKHEEWNQKWCPLCGMDLKVYSKTVHRLHHADGRIVGYCSIHCAAKDLRKNKEQVEKMDVAGFVSGEFFPVEQAHYLVGSDLPGVMTVVGKKAFASLDEAKKFQKEHGGEIHAFQETLEMVYAGIDKDNQILMRKMGAMELVGKKVEEKYGCFKCHGVDGKGGGDATGFITPRFAQRIGAKPVLKDAIMKKGHAEDSFQDKISPKELQALMLYVWGIRNKSN